MSLTVTTLSERILKLVRERILSGAIPFDKPIRQDPLAHELGVSKIPLREALVRLEQEGLLVSRANRGYFVCPLTVGEAEEVFALRLKLEPEAVALASRLADDTDRTRAATALQALDAAQGETADRVGPLNRAFHLALILPAQKPITIQLLERLHILSQRYVDKHLEPPGREDRASCEHQTILDAWSAGDAALAAKHVHTHINLTLRDLRKQFANE